MIEKIIVLEEVDLVTFYGVNNNNLQLIKSLYPKLRIVARGNNMKVLGDEEEMCIFEDSLNSLIKHCAQYNSLNEEAIIKLSNGGKADHERTENVIVYNVTGKPITPRSENQIKLVKAFHKNDMIFAVGPAGTGKIGRAHV